MSRAYRECPSRIGSQNIQLVLKRVYRAFQLVQDHAPPRLPLGARGHRLEAGGEPLEVGRCDAAPSGDNWHQKIADAGAACC